MSKSDFLVEINYLRGFSILLVVLSHFFWIWGGGVYLANTSFQYKFIANIILGDTVLFVFISGFLFYHIFYRRGFPTLSKFMFQKFKNVFSPYVIVVAVMILCQYFVIIYYLNGKIWDNPQSFLLDTFFYWSFWYVPFIMLVFFLSPMYICFVEASLKQKLLILMGSSLVSLLIGRDNFSPIHSVVYWQTAYLFGIICAQYYKFISDAKLRYWVAFILFYIAITSFCILHGDVQVDEKMTLFATPLHLNFVLISKMLFCVVAIGIFKLLSKIKLGILSTILNKLAKYSFSIYFIHNFFILIIVSYFSKNGVDSHRSNAHDVLVCAAITTIIVCFSCSLVAAVIKKLTGKYSRYFIGA